MHVTQKPGSVSYDTFKTQTRYLLRSMMPACGGWKPCLVCVGRRASCIVRMHASSRCEGAQAAGPARHRTEVVKTALEALSSPPLTGNNQLVASHSATPNPSILQASAGLSLGLKCISGGPKVGLFLNDGVGRSCTRSGPTRPKDGVLCTDHGCYHSSHDGSLNLNPTDDLEEELSRLLLFFLFGQIDLRTTIRLGLFAAGFNHFSTRGNSQNETHKK